MGHKSPEVELEEFLAAQNAYMRNLLQLEHSLSQDELHDYQWWRHLSDGSLEKKYESIIRRIPQKWRDYCKRRKQIALLYLPRAKRGRPRTSPTEDAAILELEKRGLNRERIAKQLGITKEAVSKRLKAAKVRISSKS